VNIENDRIISCPHCKVCSIKLSAEEYALVEAGQQMIEVCQVCGKEVYLDGCDQ
jgi:predicted  nucleic acid-binding Zn-ribbon protein